MKHLPIFISLLILSSCDNGKHVPPVSGKDTADFEYSGQPGPPDTCSDLRLRVDQPFPNHTTLEGYAFPQGSQTFVPSLDKKGDKMRDAKGQIWVCDGSKWVRVKGKKRRKLPTVTWNEGVYLTGTGNDILPDPQGDLSQDSDTVPAQFQRAYDSVKDDNNVHRFVLADHPFVLSGRLNVFDSSRLVAYQDSSGHITVIDSMAAIKALFHVLNYGK